MADSLLTQELAASRTPSRPNGWTTFEAAVEIISDYLGAGGSSSSSSETLQVPVLLTDGTQTIPAGAKGWTISVISGTATINSQAGFPAGVSLSSSRTLATSFSVEADADSQVFIAWTI